MSRCLHVNSFLVLNIVTMLLGFYWSWDCQALVLSYITVQLFSHCVDSIALIQLFVTYRIYQPRFLLSYFHVRMCTLCSVMKSFVHSCLFSNVLLSVLCSVFLYTLWFHVV